MPYEYQKNAKVDKGQIIQNQFREIKLEFPYTCDGCGERCLLSANLRTVPSEPRFVGDIKSMFFKVVPEMRVGDKKLFEFPVNRPNVYYPRGCNLSVYQICGDTKLCLDDMCYWYKSALVWCRKTCKHSKLR